MKTNEKSTDALIADLTWLTTMRSALAHLRLVKCDQRDRADTVDHGRTYQGAGSVAMTRRALLLSLAALVYQPRSSFATKRGILADSPRSRIWLINAGFVDEYAIHRICDTFHCLPSEAVRMLHG